MQCAAGFSEFELDGTTLAGRAIWHRVWRAPTAQCADHECMTREDITQQIIAARLAKGLTWQQLADAIGKPVMWTTAALLGQHPIPPDEGNKLVELLGLDASAVPGEP